jgi:hypothetical protein
MPFEKEEDSECEAIWWQKPSIIPRRLITTPQDIIDALPYYSVQELHLIADAVVGHLERLPIRTRRFSSRLSFLQDKFDIYIDTYDKKRENCLPVAVEKVQALLLVWRDDREELRIGLGYELKQMSLCTAKCEVQAISVGPFRMCRSMPESTYRNPDQELLHKEMLLDILHKRDIDRFILPKFLAWILQHFSLPYDQLVEHI